MQNNAFQCNRRASFGQKEEHASGGGRRNEMAMAQSKRACASRLGRFWQVAGEESLNTNGGRIKDSKKMQGLLSITSQCNLAK